MWRRRGGYFVALRVPALYSGRVCAAVNLAQGLPLACLAILSISLGHAEPVTKTTTCMRAAFHAADDDVVLLMLHVIGYARCLCMALLYPIPLNFLIQPASSRVFVVGSNE